MWRQLTDTCWLDWWRPNVTYLINCFPLMAVKAELSWKILNRVLRPRSHFAVSIFSNNPNNYICPFTSTFQLSVCYLYRNDTIPWEGQGKHLNRWLKFKPEHIPMLAKTNINRYDRNRADHRYDIYTDVTNGTREPACIYIPYASECQDNKYSRPDEYMSRNAQWNAIQLHRVSVWYRLCNIYTFEIFWSPDI